MSNIKENNFGIVFHWGIYSVLAYDDPVSARRRKTQNGSEWAKKRLEEKGNFRPVSGWKETQLYFQEQNLYKNYDDLSNFFLCEKWDVDGWMELCKSVGASYVILTSKHHDGFCLWDTKTTDHNSYLKGPKRDLLKEFELSAKKYKLRFGIYYSWYEFDKGCTVNYMNNIVDKQIKELLTYKPDIFWFDGDWCVTTKYAKNKIYELCNLIKTTNKNIEINDRLSDAQHEDINYLGQSTFRVYKDRFIPKEKPKVKWEHINTIGNSWGRNKQQKEKDYKTGIELNDIYQTVTKLDGFFLLNLGPNSDGTLDPIEIQRLKDFYNTK